MAEDIEKAEGEVVEDEPKKKKIGRPRKTDAEKIARMEQLRDDDDARIADYASYRLGKLYEKNATTDILTAAVGNAFFDQKTGKSRWVQGKGWRRPPAYTTPEELLKAIVLWENFCMAKIEKGEKIIPDAEFLASGLGVSMKTIGAWRRGERGEAFRTIIEDELNAIAAIKNQLAMNSAIHPVVWATMMNNVHGYTQHQKVEVDVRTRQLPSKDELIRKANMLPGD